MRARRANKGISVRIDYSVKYDVTTEYQWAKEFGFCKMYGLDKIQRRYYYEVFRTSANKEEAVEWAKKDIMDEVRRHSPTKVVAIRFDNILV